MAIPLESLSARLGSSLGQGLSTGLQQLAQNKVDQMIRARTASGLESSGLFTGEQARGLAALDPQLLNVIVGAKAKTGYAPQKDMTSRLAQIESTKRLIPGISDQEAIAIVDAQPSLQNQFFKNYFSNVPTEQGAEEPTGIEALQQFAQPEGRQQSAVEAITAPSEATVASKEPLKREKISPIEQVTKKELKVPEGKKTITQRIAEERENKLNQKQQEAEQKRIDKETQPIVDKIKKDNDFADFSEPRFKEMKKLVKEGGLPVSTFYTLYKNVEDHITPAAGAAAGSAIGTTVGAGLGAAGTIGVGGIPGAITGGTVGSAVGAGIGALLGPIGTLLRYGQRLTSPNTEKFEKLSATFLRGARDVFGGRFTNEEMKAYLAMIPTLANTDKGKLDIIEDAQLFNKASKIRYKAYNDILRENKGKRPLDFIDQLDARTKPELDKLADIFRDDIIEYAEDIAKQKESGATRQRLIPALASDIRR